MADLPQPYLLFVGDVAERGFAKTALGLRDWAGDKCVGEFATTADAVAVGGGHARAGGPIDARPISAATDVAVRRPCWQSRPIVA